MTTGLIDITVTILQIGELNTRRLRYLRSHHLECWERMQAMHSLSTQELCPGPAGMPAIESGLS